MKSIKEKAKEYHRVIRVINKHSTIIDTQCSEMFVEGANYVLDEIENLVKTTIGGGETYHYNLYIGLVNLIEQLKK
jgi:hypothetical protein